MKQDIPKAVALFYDGESAPVIAAKGIGMQAEQILEIAEEYDIPLCDNPALLELLATLELGESIPETLYIAVAHIIAFAYQLRTDTANYQGSASSMPVPPKPQ